MNKIIEVNNLNYSYEKINVLVDVNLFVLENDFISIIGPNGSGKTTLIKLMLNELKSKNDQIKIFNQPINEFNDWQYFSYLSQDSTLIASSFPASVFEIVRLNLYSSKKMFSFFNKEDNKKVFQVLRLLKIEDLAHQKINELSGGQKQRVLLAKALVNDPKVLFLDEPTTGVDYATINDLYNILDTLHTKHNLSIVMISHDYENVLKFANRYYCLENNNLIELSKEELKEEMLHKHIHPKGCDC